MIDTASVRRELPAAIAVRISEHVPLAILDLGRKFIVNTRGEIFKEMADGDPKDLTVITGLTFSDITVGTEPRSAPFEAVMAVFRLARDEGGRIPFEKFRQIHVDRDMGLTLHAADRIKAVKIGFDDYREKFRKLESILSFLNSRHRFSNVDAIDLNNLNRIVVTPAATQPPGIDHKEA